MTPKQINLTFTIQVDAYEFCKIGGTFDVEPNENLTDATVAARDELRKAFKAIYNKENGKFIPSPSAEQQAAVANELKQQLL